jgi:ATPase subunit of ABC transporter with duplicated ATPase domains
VESIVWLEGWLKAIKGTLVMTSHDREFMTRVCSRTIEVAYGTITTYSGDCDFYLREREIRRAQLIASPKTPGSDAHQGRGIHRALRGLSLARGPGTIARIEDRKNREDSRSLRSQAHQVRIRAGSTFGLHRRGNESAGQ